MKKVILLFTLVTLLLGCSKPGTKGFENFITRDGHRLMDGDKEYRFISMNIPNLNYIEDELSFSAESPYRYPNEFEIRDAFETVKQMGGKVIRIYTLPVKRQDEPDNPTFITGPGEFTEEAFVVNDLMLKIANEMEIRIIFSLLNNWKWMGGVPQYAAFRGKPAEDFWTDEQLIDDFKNTVEFTLNRTNTLTGVKYKDDKAILCWETGNELMSPYPWVKEMAAYIKEIDTNHLLMDGFHAVDDYRYIHKESVEDPNIDILSSHHYETDPFQQFVNIHSNLDIIKGKKPYILGELGFESTSAHERVYDYIISNHEIAGTLNWSIRSHRREGGFYWHSEPVGHGLYKAYHWPGFPSGHAYDEKGLLTLMRKKAYEIDGKVPPELPVPKAPGLLPAQHVYEISWQGSTGASGYNIYRSESDKGPWEQIAFNVSDARVQYTPLFNDATAEIDKTYFYKIKAVNAVGVSPESNILGPIKVEKKALVDEMGNLMTLYRYKDITVEKGQDRKFKEDTERIQGTQGSEIIYSVPGSIRDVKIYAFETFDQNGLELMVSGDGENFEPINPKISGEDLGEGDYGYWNAKLYESSNDKNSSQFLKIVFKEKSQIGRTVITYN
ncbi:hypothetical protein [Robertkochia aurantiaca]|uniref:hypothetical protein n=1 Tax=Robertkochia aurantiaca TaxID=2873700 RepID=UPI001CCEBF42|nr:hypothetical protein [Robertkochia sp. 3YJGBD-33]